MMNAHDKRRQRRQSLTPRHPMRDGPHFDGREDGVAQHPSTEKILHGSHRLVVAHVLVDGQRDAGAGA